MVIQEVPVLMSVKQLGLFLNKSKSWLYAEWGKKENDLPPKFKIGSSTRIKGVDAISYLERHADQSGAK